MTFLVPAADRDTPSSVDRSPNPPPRQCLAADGNVWVRDPSTDIATGETDLSGVYEAQLRTLEGTLRHRRFALNMDPIESDLSMPSATELVDRLAPLEVRIDDAEDLLFQTGERAGQSWSEILLIAALDCCSWRTTAGLFGQLSSEGRGTRRR